MAYTPMWLNIYLLGAVSFFTDVSSEMIKALLPAFLGALGAGGLALGIVGNLPQFFQGLTHYASGSLSDKMGRRKPLIFAGYLVSSISKLLIAAAPGIAMLTFARSCERIGKGIRIAPRDSFIGETIPRAFLGKAFGIHKMMDSSGAAVGTLAAFFLWQAGLGIRTILAVAAAAAFIALLPLTAIKEKKSRLPKNPPAGSRAKLNSIFIYTGIFSTANINFLFFITYIQSCVKASLKSSVAVGILAYIIYNFFYAAFSVPAGKFTDRTSSKKTMFAGNAFFTALCLVFLTVKIPGLLMPSMIIFAASAAFIKVSQKTWISALSDGKKLGKSMGAFRTIETLCLLAGGIIQGLLWNVSATLTFAWGFAVSAVSLLLLVFI